MLKKQLPGTPACSMAERVSEKLSVQKQQEAVHREMATPPTQHSTTLHVESQKPLVQHGAYAESCPLTTETASFPTLVEHQPHRGKELSLPTGAGNYFSLQAT